MTSQKEPKDQSELIKKMKILINNLQRSNVMLDQKHRRQAQEIRELKTENAYLKDRARKNG
jgi:hypothetical protein